MKKILFVLLFITVVAHAQPGDDDGGGGLNHNTYTPSTVSFPNPERGFYHQKVDCPEYPGYEYPELEIHDQNNQGVQVGLDSYRAENISVILRTFYLSEFVTEDNITTEYLNNMRADFNKIRSQGLKVIVRFAYTDNNNIVQAPNREATLQRILNHIQDVSTPLNENQDIIIAYQFGWIGVWGENYYTSQTATFGSQSSITSAQWLNRKQVVDAMLSSCPNILVQVRTIKIKQTMYPSGNDRIGFFNDAFLNTGGDEGTFPNVNGNNPPAVADANYLIQETESLPMTGETNAVNAPRTNCPNAMLEMEKYNWSIIDKDYLGTNITNWINNGCYTEMERNLGYRFELVDSSITNNNFTLNLNNVGYANVFRQRPAFLVLRNTTSGVERSIQIASDIRTWKEGAPIVVTTSLSSINPALEPGSYQLFLNLPDPSASLSANPAYSIQCANQNVWESSTGYNDLGMTYVVSPSLTLSAATATICKHHRASVTITSPIGNFDSYVWNFPTEVAALSATEFSFAPTSTKTYVLTATNSTTGQTTTASFAITVNPGPLVTLNTYNVTMVCSSAATMLTATLSESDTQTAVVWNPISGLFTNPAATVPYTGGQAATVYAKPTIGMAYFATATNNNGCSFSALASVNVVGTWFRDSDGDGKGDINNSSCSPQAGYVTDNTDCDDTDATKYRMGFLFQDFDGDGFNNGMPSDYICYGAVPPNYTNNNIGTDCDDTRFEVNPNHVEVLANGIDDNCSGEIDEVNPTTSVILPQCGSTLTSMWDSIFVQQITSPVAATAYRFEVTNTVDGTVRTYDSNVSRFSFMNLQGQSAFATRYSIRVSPKINGFFRAYGSPCDLFTPTNRPTTSLTSNDCNKVLTSLWNSIYAYQVSGLNVTAYEFRVQLGNVLVGTSTGSASSFNFMNLSLASGQSVQFGTTYTVDVRLQYGSTWETNYGVACNVTTPPNPPSVQLQPASCGITVSSHSTMINAYTSGYASPTVGYRFVLRYADANNVSQVAYIDRLSANFRFQDFPGGTAAVLPGKVYNITVQYFFNGSYQPEGPSCSVTTAANFTKTSAGVSLFDVITHPNPFSNAFMLDLTTSSNQAVEVSVYDMIGKLIESTKINAAELQNHEFGGNYAAGVYNVIVAQQDNVKSLRVIKK